MCSGYVSADLAKVAVRVEGYTCTARARVEQQQLAPVARPKPVQRSLVELLQARGTITPAEALERDRLRQDVVEVVPRQLTVFDRLLQQQQRRIEQPSQPL